MPNPNVIRLTPNTGLTSGRNFVEIIGSGFRLPPTPPLSGSVPKPSSSVRVKFGTAVSVKVMVITQGRLIVEVPLAKLPVVKPNFGAGSVDITVENISQSGQIIGDPFILPGGYTYTRKDLAEESSVLTLSRAVIQELQRQTISNVVMSTHTDYDGNFTDGLNITELASLPALIVTGPKLVENKTNNLPVKPYVTYTSSGQSNQPDGDGLLDENGDPIFTEDGFPLTTVLNERIRFDTPYTVDATYNLIGVSDSQQEIQNLMDLVVQFFHINQYIDVNGKTFEIMFNRGGQPDARSSASNSNIRSFSSSFFIQAFNISTERVMDISADLSGTPELEAGLTYPNLEPHSIELPLGSIYQLEYGD